MRLDASLAFVPVNAPLSLVGGAGVQINAPNIIDLLGTGVGTAPTSIYGTTTNYGDAGFGLGQIRVEMAVALGAAATTSNSATLTVALQGAPDTGSAGGYVPTTWTSYVQSGAMTAAQLTINQVIFRFPWLPPFPANARPRFLRLAFIVPSATNFSAGTIAYAVPSLGRDDYGVANVPKNYVVG